MILLEYVNRVMAWHKSRDRGATAVEYALVAGLIVAVLVVGITFLGGKAQALLNTACHALDNSKATC